MKAGAFQRSLIGCSMHNTFVEASDGFEIRIASERDLESLTVALGTELSAAHIAQRFEESRSGIRTMLIATIDGHAVGTISIGGGRFQRQGSLRLFALNVGLPSGAKVWGPSW